MTYKERLDSYGIIPMETSEQWTNASRDLRNRVNRQKRIFERLVSGYPVRAKKKKAVSTEGSA